MVIVNGSESSEAAVAAQGSILGPLLFLIYIDDLPSVVQNLLGHSKVNLFADDILLHHLISNPADYILLQLAVSLIEEWSISNFLSFNAGKCKYNMIVSRKQSPIIPSNSLKLFGNLMQRVNCYKYLGLPLTTNLSWSAHISTICTIAKKILGLSLKEILWFCKSDHTQTTLPFISSTTSGICLPDLGSPPSQRQKDVGECSKVWMQSCRPPVGCQLSRIT